MEWAPLQSLGTKYVPKIWKLPKMVHDQYHYLIDGRKSMLIKMLQALLAPWSFGHRGHPWWYPHEAERFRREEAQFKGRNPRL
jgi:hypothetical protein